MNSLSLQVTKNRIYFLLIFILIFALLVRAFRAYSGLPYLYYWDEPQIASNALQMLKSGSFNPNFFSYGTLTIYINYMMSVLHYLYLMAQSDTATTFLTSLSEIQTVWDTKWHWTISHPSFFYWGRIVNVLFGTGTVWMVYLISREILKYRLSCVFATAAIAVMGVHVRSSAIISPDIPVAFFISTTTLFCLYFWKNKKTEYFFTALIFSGCAIATKYNSSVVLIMPIATLLAILIRQREAFKFHWILLLSTIPLLAFLFCMPFALIDSVSFLRDLGDEVRHYKVLGHKGAMSEPGLKHALFQLENFKGNIGFIGLFLVFLGLLNVLRAPKLVLIIVLLSSYFIYMTQMKVNFHRNYIFFYPFIAILYGSACELIYTFGKQLASISARPIVHKLFLAVNCGLALIVLSAGWSEMSNSLTVRFSRDSRTLIIDKLNNLNPQKIYLAEELRIHYQDLKRLVTPYQLLKLSEIFSCPSKVTNGLIVLPSNVWISSPSSEDRQQLLSLSEKLKGIDKKMIEFRMGPSDKGTSLDIFTINPELLVVHGSSLHFCE